MTTDRAFLDGLRVRPIDRQVDLSRFACNKELDWFLRSVALDHHENRITYVTCWLHGDDLAGYMSTAMTKIELSDLGQRQEAGLVGVVYTEGGTQQRWFAALLIGMLGVCDRFRGKGLGPHMVQYAIGEARAATAGCRFVTVDSMLTTDALKMYERLRFKRGIKKKMDERGTVWMYYDLLRSRGAERRPGTDVRVRCSAAIRTSHRQREIERAQEEEQEETWGEALERVRETRLN